MRVELITTILAIISTGSNATQNNTDSFSFRIEHNGNNPSISVVSMTERSYSLLKDYPKLFTRYWFTWCRVISRFMLWVIITLEFPVLSLLALFLVYALYTVIRIKLWSQYNTQTKANVETKGDGRDRDRGLSSSDSSDEDSDGTEDEQSTFRVPVPSFASHLQQFLSAIRIFGYLEKPLFHELTKNMKTQTMEKGELLVLDKYAGFPILVEGTLEIYYELETGEDEQSEYTEEEEEEKEADDSDEEDERKGFEAGSISDSSNEYRYEHEQKSNLDHDPTAAIDSGCIYLKDGLGKFQLLNVLKPGNPVSSLVDILTLFTSHPTTTTTTAEQLKSGSSSPVIIARAVTDVTIAIIPPEAFVTMTNKYPRAASHVIRIILTKLYHVTFKTANEYLGLTREIMEIENLLNKSTGYRIPSYLRQYALKMITEKDPQGLSSMGTDKSRQDKAQKRGRPVALKASTSTRHIYINSRDEFNPGDLLSHVPIQRRAAGMVETSTHGSEGTPERTPYVLNEIEAQIEETEECAVRMAIAEAILEYLGVDPLDYTKKGVASEIPSVSDNSSGTESTNSSLSSISRDLQIKSILEAKNSGTGHPLKTLPSSYFLGPTKRSKNGGSSHMTDNSAIKNKGDGDDTPGNLDLAKMEFSQSLELKMFKRGTRIVEQGSDGKGLFYILKGEISVSFDNLPLEWCQKPRERRRAHQVHLFTLRESDLGGYLSSLIGYRSFVNLTAKTDVYVGFLPDKAIERLCEKYFFLYLRLAETLTGLLQPILLKLDHSLEWVHLDASETLFKEKDPANGIYLILSGRLRQFQKRGIGHPSGSASNTSKDCVIGELTQGESLGEVEVLTATNRDSTVVAIRETELARIPRTLFEVLAMEYPSIMVRVSRLVAKKIRRNKNIPTDSIYGSNVASMNNTKGSSIGDSTNYRTISILPVTENLPLEEFAPKLISALRQVGRTTIGLNQSVALAHLGRHAFDRYAKLKQSGYFADLEQQYQTVVYIGDPSINSSWNRTCIAQGDCILLLADATAAPRVGKEYKKLLLGSKSTANMKLILLHPEPYVTPGLTHEWLKDRPWINSHHHIQFLLPKVPIKNSYSKGNPMNSIVEKLIQGDFTKKTQYNISKFLPFSIKNLSSRFIIRKKRPFYNQMHRHKDDFLRLARILSGQAIGLVLGGGGARGISHLGIIDAIEEQGIPIDMVGGTSIGSFVGGLYARDYNVVSMYGRIKQFSGRLASKWRMILDLTWPVTSYTTGHEFNRGIWKAFGETKIEDFWLPFYCNSTNITDSVEEIHTHGYAWRYIRASMSLAGLLPPLEDGGSMLLDGGYLDNLPVSEMKRRGCATILAVDVGSVDDRTPMRYGDSLNGFWIIFNRWNPFSKHPNIPSMVEIQTRLGYVASVNALEEAKNTKGVVYIRPPVEGYDTLAFSKFEELYQLGAEYGRKFFQDLVDRKKMPQLSGISSPSTRGSEIPEFLLQRRNSI